MGRKPTPEQTMRITALNLAVQYQESGTHILQTARDFERYLTDGTVPLTGRGSD